MSVIHYIFQQKPLSGAINEKLIFHFILYQEDRDHRDLLSYSPVLLNDFFCFLFFPYTIEFEFHQPHSPITSAK